ncbi:preprotein translocase subunit SecE [Herbihabitans rhizosphaerae]|uniref:Protein translocase subunit SecE n=1 Tax=Herbihabitans rhizosphaerae TaxID=1872711 RepID=A0A4Q7KWN6_9PSEU|nr:preprotein translocase subunit SecE [Herbihabitans rhizosphaerae]RZS40700.1 preprotein translocase subunit SecE [Herbihabitans rhizosphaerae]
MAEDRDKKREEGQERPSRPVTAAARRERRGSARPEAKKPASKRTGDSAAKSGSKDKAAKADSKSVSADRKGRATPTRDGRETKQALPKRMFRFLREVVAELRKVIWPTRKQMITYTAVVLVFVAFMVALVSVLDLVLAKGVLALFGE